MTRLTPDPEILALAESDEPDCGKEFNPGLCRTRHLAAKAREARGLEHGLCAYCPLILKHLGIVTKSADGDTPTCATCGNTLTKNGFCHSCRSTAQRAREAEKRPMCKTCGLRAPRKGFSICTNCLCKKDKPAIEPDKPQTQEEPKPMTTTENKPIEKQPAKKRPATCKQCGKPCTFNESGLCRSCSAARNARKAREAKPLSEPAKSTPEPTPEQKPEPQRCPKCGKKLTKNGFCYTCAAHEREAKKNKARKPVCKRTAPKVTQEKSNVTLDMPGVGTCPEPAADTSPASAATVGAATLITGTLYCPKPTPGRADGSIIRMQPESIYRRALRHYGDRNQILKAAEEASELSAAIMRYLSMQSDNGMSPVISLVEELADVEIMCQQMRLVFGDQPVDAAKRQKLERLERRLEE